MHALRRVCVIFMVMVTTIAGFSSASATVDGTTFTNDAYGITVNWGSDWSVVRETRSGVSLKRGEDVTFEVAIWSSRTEDAALLNANPGETLREDTSTSDIPGAIFDKDDGTFRQVEVQDINDVRLQFIVTGSSPDAVGYVQNEITVDDASPLFAQTVTEQPEDLTGDATPEADATAVSTEVANDDVGAQVFTGPVFGYTVQYDSTIWTQDAVFEDDYLDGVRLISDDAALTVWAWNGYGSDAEACLAGESAFYANEVDKITNWTLASNANGDLEYISDDLSWGVFTLEYDGQKMVDYISCQPIPGQDAVLITMLNAFPESYNSSLNQALDITDTLQFTESGSTQLSTGDDTTRADISTAVDGTVYTSPNYGFTVDVPLEWAVVEEDDTPGDERLVLSNGTSTVTVWAVDATFDDLSACVDFAADESGLDLTVDETSSGGEFRGEYGDQAFANFVYEAEDGTRMTYYVGCQEMPDGDGYVIVIQDVPYDKFTSERRHRLDIEDSITFP